MRISRSRSNGKLYEYAQLVESYRRPADGMPSHRVVANLGPPGTPFVENLQASLAASRQNKRVIVAKVGEQTRLKPTANLRYLDLAVLLRVFFESGLAPVLSQAFPESGADIPSWKVILALMLQRCVAPGSKLYAERWFKETALPELLDIDPKQFNNTRLHRTLAQLYAVTPLLMAKVSRAIGQRNAPARSLFLDLTDTWFVGHGPDTAQKAKTKEGFIRRKIGIVLLCNAAGLPLRWQVVSGKTEDGSAMHAMLEDIEFCPWVKDRPLVCDRAMGNTADIEKLLARKLHFLTALVRTEFDNYTDAIPYQPFFDISVDDEKDKQVLQRVKRALAATDMIRVNGTLWTLDLGIVNGKASKKTETGAAIEGASRSAVAMGTTDTPEASQTDESDSTVRTIRLGRQVREAIDSGQVNSIPQAASLFGCAFSTAKGAVRLARRLSESIQQDILAHQAVGVSGKALQRMLQGQNEDDPDTQRHEFDILCEQARERPRASSQCHAPPKQAAPCHPNLTARGVRAVVAFNPTYFLQKRANAQDKLRTIEAYARNLNKRLQKSTCRMSHADVLAEVKTKLRTHTALTLFTVAINEADDKSLQVTLTLDQKKWERQRRYDGFNLLVAAPEIDLSAAELAQLYRDKDAVEKDFQTIKSFIKLRPVHHRTACKVEAHVTVCVLALLVERLVQERLDTVSAQGALETLGSCNLNLYAPSTSASPPTYLVTSANTKQQALLKTLKMTDLADDDLIAERISPRK